MTIYNAPPDQVNGITLVGDTLNVGKGGIVSRVTVGIDAKMIVSGTAVNTVLAGGQETISSSGSANGITFLTPSNGGPFDLLVLENPTSLQLAFDASFGRGFKAIIQFPLTDVTSITNTSNTVTVNYGQEQSVTYHYEGPASFDFLPGGNSIDVLVSNLGSKPAFSPDRRRTFIATLGGVGSLTRCSGMRGSAPIRVKQTRENTSCQRQ